MSKKPTPAKRSGGKQTSARERYEVGYARPPKKTQFKPGQSGNPKGRPKGAKNEATILKGILNRRLEIREAGRARKISVLEAMLLKFTEDALKGNTKSAVFLLNRYRGFDGPETEPGELDQDDRQILDDFAKRLEIQLKKEGPSG
jgi:hypothetical protein